ncbi:hypothetical protein BDF19DRAFT_415521 [Syncephalis fuscata]|nr:hypothetical protein BDF19DRAFT_415521 [Syncephalis fuscata]
MYLFYLVIAQLIVAATAISVKNDLTTTRHLLHIDPMVYNSSRVPFTPHNGTEPMTSYLEQTLNYTSLQASFEELRQQVPRSLKSRGEAHITVITPPEFDDALQKVGITMDEVNAIALRRNIQQNHFRILCVGRARVLRPNATSHSSSSSDGDNGNTGVGFDYKSETDNRKDERGNSNSDNIGIDMATIHAEQAVEQMKTLPIDVLLQDAPTATLVTPTAKMASSPPIDPYMEVYFLVVESSHLMAIREEIGQLFHARGGKSKDFNAATYWPHITLGFTDRDLFIQDGVFKDRSTCWANIRVEGMKLVYR